MPAHLDRSLSRVEAAEPSAAVSTPDGAAPTQVVPRQNPAQSQPSQAGPVGTTTAGPPSSAGAPTVATPAAGAVPGRAAPTRDPSLAPDLGGRLRDLTWLASAVVDLFLALDFVLRALSAPNDGFVVVVTRVGDGLASPFMGIVSARAPRLGLTHDWPLVLAVVVYTVAAWLLVRLWALIFGTVPAGRA